MAWEPTLEQARVIAHDPTRHARLLAGPGTGKSGTIVRFLAKVAQQRAGRGQLLTFTRAATSELREKVVDHGRAITQPSTIHAFSISTLLANPGTSGLPQPLRIADDWEKKALIYPHLRELVGCTVKMIKRCEAEMASDWEGLEPAVDSGVPDDIRARFVGLWDHHRSVFGYSLLAELPYRLLRALQDHQDLYIGDWDFLVVDEYQDLNLCDLRVLYEISRRGRALIGTGDDDQSIYSFRKAHPIGIQRFLEDYPEAVDYTLSILQRCARRILKLSNFVIQGLPNRPVKPLLRPADHCGDGEVRYLQFGNWTLESRGVSRLVTWLIRERSVAPEDIAVMFRTDHNNSWSAPLKESLLAQGVPVVNRSEVKAMLSDVKNRKLIAVARLVVNREDSLGWWTILHSSDGIGVATWNHFYKRADKAGLSFGFQLLADHLQGYPDLRTSQRNRVKRAVDSVLPLLDEVRVEYADLGNAGWGRWLLDRTYIFGECEDRFADLLLELDDYVDRTEGLGRFLGQIQPIGQDLRSGRPAQGVRLMTMTASKGLTVEAAIVVGVEEGIIPRPSADLAEERRLLYVAMTRSTKYLFLTWSASRTGPTARAGEPRVARGRNRSPLLTHGPVASEVGTAYLRSIGAWSG